MQSHKLILQTLPDCFGVFKMEATAEIPFWVTRSVPSSITRSGDELSIVCRLDDIAQGFGPVHRLRGWRLTGISDFVTDGGVPSVDASIIAALAVPLAEAGARPLLVPAFQKDSLYFVLVGEDSYTSATEALRRYGHYVE